MAQDAGLVVVLDLHGAPGSQNGLDNSGQRATDPRPERYLTSLLLLRSASINSDVSWGIHWFYDRENQDKTTEILVTMAKYIDVLVEAGIDNVVALGTSSPSLYLCSPS